jgi:hypothetical protein
MSTLPIWNPEDDEDYLFLDEEIIDEQEEDGEEYRQCSCSSHCMNCLGLSWREFL